MDSDHDFAPIRHIERSRDPPEHTYKVSIPQTIETDHDTVLDLPESQLNFEPAPTVTSLRKFRPSQWINKGKSGYSVLKKVKNSWATSKKSINMWHLYRSQDARNRGVPLNDNKVNLKWKKSWTRKMKSVIKQARSQTSKNYKSKWLYDAKTLQAQRWNWV